MRHNGPHDRTSSPPYANQVCPSCEPSPGVEASVTPRRPQAAVVGIAITDRWELLFDTVTQSRKHQNLVANPRVAFVIGWEHERTVQYKACRASHGGGAARRAGLYSTVSPMAPPQSWPASCTGASATWIR